MIVTKVLVARTAGDQNILKMELSAIALALQHTRNKHTTIATDCLSAISIIISTLQDNPTNWLKIPHRTETRRILQLIESRLKPVHFIKVKAHSGTRSHANEIADTMAKEASQFHLPQNDRAQKYDLSAIPYHANHRIESSPRNS